MQFKKQTCISPNTILHSKIKKRLGIYQFYFFNIVNGDQAYQIFSNQVLFCLAFRNIFQQFWNILVLIFKFLLQIKHTKYTQNKQCTLLLAMHLRALGKIFLLLSIACKQKNTLTLFLHNFCSIRKVSKILGVVQKFNLALQGFIQIVFWITIAIVYRLKLPIKRNKKQQYEQIIFIHELQVIFFQKALKNIKTQ
eukprot:TRINITY_DN1538_c0_g1_i11.p4 TRINITY_DN1538_c0_g1~~TRINITY_DN1538_c0_g1_i11.p4  ORF type:complete len:195 (-),score=-8.58 TRINITY_DN1538_c0_g1_i11:576-1160(-)